MEGRGEKSQKLGWVTSLNYGRPFNDICICDLLKVIIILISVIKIIIDYNKLILDTLAIRFYIHIHFFESLVEFFVLETPNTSLWL